MYRILVCNDDGIESAGLKALVKTLKTFADVYVVAPAEQMSATGQSLTFRRPVAAEEVSLKGAKKAFKVTGTPADCVKLGLKLLREKDREPDFVISGINRGINTGTSVFYSGTIAAAREGALNGIRSIALSVDKHDTENFGYVCSMLKELLELSAKFEPSTMLSVNAPDLPEWKVKGVRFAPSAPHGFGEDFVFDKVSENEYQMYVSREKCDKRTENDVNYVAQGYAVITPVTIETNDYRALRSMTAMSCENSITVFVDFQTALVPVMYGAEELMKNTTKFAKCLRRLDFPMRATMQYSKGLGAVESELDEAMGRYEEVEKLSFSCLDDPLFERKIQGSSSNKVILCGIEAHICLQQTALDFLARGYEVYIASDCCSSRNKKDYKAAMNLLAAKGCVVTTWESIVYDIMKSSTHPAFKAVSKIVKE